MGLGIGSWLKETIGNTASEVIESVGSTVDRFVTTDAERSEMQLEMQKLALRFKQLEMDAEEALLKDRQSAREMYKHDSSLQKVYAIVFLVGYIGITAVMLWWLFGLINAEPTALELPNWAAALISSIFTAMSTKVATITDFLFGGSQTDSDNRDVARQFEQAARQAE